MRRLKILLGIVVATFGLLFGTSVLNNIHNSYLRVLSSRVVKLTNVSNTGGATGWIVKGKSGEKYIMTNNHVCEMAQSGTLIAHYGGESFPVYVHKTYVWNDLCALKAHQDLGMAFSIAGSDSLGESTWAIGHPLLEPTTVSTGELSGPVVSSILIRLNPTKESCSGPTYFIIDLSDTIYSFFGIESGCVRVVNSNAGTMSIQPGSSGSPVVNQYGNVVAVAFAANESGTRSYFVPLSDLKDFLNQL